MEMRRELLKGLAASALSLCLVMGALMLSLAEDLHFEGYRGASFSYIQHTPTEISALEETPAVTEQPQEAESLLDQAMMLTLMAETPECVIRKDWKPYIIQPGDSLVKLAEVYLLSIKELKQGNCLSGDELTPGNIIFLPERKIVLSPFVELPTITPNVEETVELTPTPQPAECIPPEGWSPYVVTENDSLRSLSQQLGVSLFAIKEANCLSYPLVVEAGDVLYLPLLATPTTAADSPASGPPDEATPAP
ncbi:MAG: LysM peptidoglycan-binding domain-containing protein [Anaerolineae bacterium]|nr:LysM peptidoglycan-binding domain-containing protein [Anaerolineae bacterium]